MRIQETAADLALVLAALSSFRGKPVAPDTVVFGEIGLAGEIRPVQAGEDRLAEAAKHGMKRALIPRGNTPKSKSRLGIEVVSVDRLQDAIDRV